MPLWPMPLGPMTLEPMPLGPMPLGPTDATPVVIAAVVVGSVVGGISDNEFGCRGGRGRDFWLNARSGMSLAVVRHNASRVNKLQLINHD